MRKRRTGRIILLILLALFLVFAVPIIINESYKANDGYVTMWEAADVLSYYGIILGALITVFALTTTIRFTKKQIQRNSYLFMCWTQVRGLAALRGDDEVLGAVGSGGYEVVVGKLVIEV